MKSELLLFVFMVFIADTSIYGGDKGSTSPLPKSDELVVYEPGNLPVIILVPHDGKVKPEGVPLRKKGTRDIATSLLARAIASQLTFTDAKNVKRKPYLVISLASRAVVELNKSWEENLEGGWTNTQGKKVKPPTLAKRIHMDFHACVDHAVKQVQKEYGSGILIDLHGLGASRKVDMYGYRVRSSSFKSEKGEGTSSDKILAQAIRKRSSIQYAASRKKKDSEVANLLRGPNSLASLVDQAYKKLYPNLKDSKGNLRGRPATPSLRFPKPKSKHSPSHDNVYFNGAYDIRAHSSYQEGITIDAIQIETTPDARNNKTLRSRFAHCMAVSLREFLQLHYVLDINPKTSEK